MPNTAIIKDGKKLCGKCKRFVEFSGYNKYKKHKTGIHSHCRDCTRAYYRSPERMDYVRRYRKNNAKRLLKWSRYYRKDLRKKTIEKYGGRCARCGNDDFRVLQIDHVNGGGKKELKQTAPTTYALRVLNDKSNKYQLLCANCNWIKRYENNEDNRNNSA